MEQVFQSLEAEFKGKVVFVNIDVNEPENQALCSRFQIQYIPTTYFLNANGEVSFNYVGVINKDEMKKKLEALAEGK